MYFGWRRSIRSASSPVVHTACDLHSRDSSNNRHDDFDNVKRDCAGFNLKDQGKYKHPETAGKTDADTPESCAQINRQQDDDEFCSNIKTCLAH